MNAYRTAPPRPIMLADAAPAPWWHLRRRLRWWLVSRLRPLVRHRYDERELARQAAVEQWRRHWRRVLVEGDVGMSEAAEMVLRFTPAMEAQFVDEVNGRWPRNPPRRPWPKPIPPRPRPIYGPKAVSE